MSAPFVTQLRSRRGTIRLGASDDSTITIRVEMPEVWDTVRIETPPAESVASVKACALAALFPDVGLPDDYVMKLNGFEVLDENAALADIGTMNGSIFLLTGRRRRPVR